MLMDARLSLLIVLALSLALLLASSGKTDDDKPPVDPDPIDHLQLDDGAVWS